MGGDLGDNPAFPDGHHFPNDLKMLQAYFTDLNGVSVAERADYLAKTGATFVDPLAGTTEVNLPFQGHYLRDDMPVKIKENNRRWCAARTDTALKI